MDLTPREREKITDGMLKIQAAWASLEEVDPGKIPEFAEFLYSGPQFCELFLDLAALFHRRMARQSGLQLLSGPHSLALL